MSAAEPELTPEETRAAAGLRRALRDIAEESPVRVDAKAWVATTRSGRRFGNLLPVGLAAALMVAIAGVSAFAVWTGNQPVASGAPQSRAGHFDNGAFSFDYPTSWRTIAGEDQEIGGTVDVVLGTGDWRSNCWVHSNESGCDPDSIDVSGGRVVVKLHERTGGPVDYCGAQAPADATFGPNAVSEEHSSGVVTWEIRRPGGEFGWLQNVFVEVTTANPAELANAEALVASFRWAPGARADWTCHQLETPTPVASQMKLSIDNETTIAVTLAVNGSVIETVPPGAYEDPIKGALPAMPWNVETRSPSGRVLSTMVVRQGDFFQTTMPNGNGAVRGDGVRVDLSCGRLDLWYGTPMLGPPFSPGPSGDCA